MLVTSNLGSPPLSPTPPPSTVTGHALTSASLAHPLSHKQEESVGVTTEYFSQKPSVPPPRTLSPPYHSAHLPPPPDREGVFVCAPLPPSLLPGNPREGQSASLLGGKYLLLEETEGGSTHKCVHIQTSKQYVCKVIPRDLSSQRLLSAHYLVDGHTNINTVQEVIIGCDHVYLVLPSSAGDLHSYVRSRRKLREATARQLFRQVVSAVHEAHKHGIVLRDLKLRKFVFTDESRLELKLESLEDAVILEDPDDDVLQDKHGCPAYVSPEILKSNTRYSGRAADMWGLGVMLYTMLVGRYPFHGAEHSGLFAKIRRGQFNLPDNLSSRARCLIKCLLKKEPEDRLTTEDVLGHPWLSGTTRDRGTLRRSPHDTADQAVPEYKQFEAAFRPAAEVANSRR